MSRLQEILDHKRTEITPLLARADHLRAAALQRNDFRGFAAALNRGRNRLGLIAEVKRASPSAGDIVTDFDPVVIAREYEAAGANAISVLTDERFFKGSISYLTLIRGEVSVPVLRKDFILHEAQIYEAICAGADAVLLIVAALEQAELLHLHELASSLQLEVLVEVHTMSELDRALEIPELRLLGVNNRNLVTFEVDLATTEELSAEVPEEVTLVSESGIRTGADTARLRECGTNAILVGESLMRAGDKAKLVAELMRSGPTSPAGPG